MEDGRWKRAKEQKSRRAERKGREQSSSAQKLKVELTITVLI